MQIPGVAGMLGGTGVPGGLADLDLLPLLHNLQVGLTLGSIFLALTFIIIEYSGSYQRSGYKRPLPGAMALLGVFNNARQAFKALAIFRIAGVLDDLTGTLEHLVHVLSLFLGTRIDIIPVCRHGLLLLLLNQGGGEHGFIQIAKGFFIQDVFFFHSLIEYQVFRYKCTNKIRTANRFCTFLMVQ